MGQGSYADRSGDEPGPAPACEEGPAHAERDQHSTRAGEQAGVRAGDREAAAGPGAGPRAAAGSAGARCGVDQDVGLVVRGVAALVEVVDLNGAPERSAPVDPEGEVPGELGRWGHAAIGAQVLARPRLRGAVPVG